MKGAGGIVGGGGEIVQVEGGHIVRSIGRKDRHSKVFTAKGPRDRRVRLSAQTAIQFYDVQDRLGYDRPSKAVDWLIKKAKTAIDKLDELPSWNPSDHHHQEDVFNKSNRNEDNQMNTVDVQQGQRNAEGLVSSPMRQQHYALFHLPQQQHHKPSEISDTMKTFFPTSSMGYQVEEGDELGLSLHSTMQESSSNHQHHHHGGVHFSGNNTPLGGFESAPFAKTAWSGGGGGGGNNGENRMGFLFNFPQTIPSSHPPPFFQSSSSSSEIPQREPLQSNYSSQFVHHAWNNRLSLHPEDHLSTHQSQMIPGGGHFAPEFQVPARMQGEEEAGVFSLRPSSSSSISHY